MIVARLCCFFYRWNDSGHLWFGNTSSGRFNDDREDDGVVLALFGLAC